MRLTCPNCDAQYEVPDDVIPPEGRDVQCSNCGSTWFQAHPEAIAAAVTQEVEAELNPQDIEHEDTAFDEVEPPEIALDDEEASEERTFADAISQSEPFAEPDSASEPEQFDDDALSAAISQTMEEDTQEDPHGFADDATFVEDERLGEDDADVDDVPEASDGDQEDWEGTPSGSPEDDQMPVAAVRPTTPNAPAAPQRRRLDPAVADVLRQEAEHEAVVRANEERDVLETQAELGLSEPEAEPSEADRRMEQARDRMRRLRGEAEADEQDLAATDIAAQRSRRDLLPDIEETNSTLRHSGDSARSAEPAKTPNTEARRGRGFRLGFLLVLIAAGAAIYVYGQQTELAAQFPQYAPQIEVFVESVNTSRIWLDAKVTDLFLKLNALTSG